MKVLLLLSLVLIVIVVIFYNYNKQQQKPKLKTITPQCLIGALRKENIVVVNVLSDKFPISLGVKDSKIKSISKLEFENMIKKDNKIPDSIDLVILFCAAWSCSAGENYYNELISRNIDVSNVVDYAGGIHEWACYSKLNSDFFKIYDNNYNQVDLNVINELVKNTGHGYKTNLLIKEDNKQIQDLCNLGLDIKF